MTGTEPGAAAAPVVIHPDPTIDQAAEALGCCRKTVRNMISRGDLRAYRVGPRMIRVDRESLNAARQGKPIPSAITS